MTTWTVMLVDHDRLFSAALATLIGGGPFRVTTHAASADDALDLIADGEEPDLIVLALQDGMPEEIAGIRRLRDGTSARIAVLADTIADRSLSQSLKAGADAYLNKSMSSESLLRSLRLVMLGEVVYPTHVAGLLMAAVNERPQHGSAYGPMPGPIGMPTSGELSKREVQILRCLLAGQSNKAIARNLHITESTVKMHFKNVMRKINAQNRTQAAVWAIQNGLSPLVTA
ncbi:two-component response regulator [Azospirillum sp. B510]|uniref:LuxR C-terminal-related transcriptional regulator n=1 Tax=Azospirillum sp. (strain B510) TaxID=137722 RepID=UPI0001C4BEEC|nr:response regulator transcription factor [Azospirillum sp. B510]BAI72829.1 two-component response regulator [Azospirillum sp. B510]